MFQDTSGDSCEHPAMADTAWAMPVTFKRAAGGAVASFAAVNWDGDWMKQ